MPWRENDCVYTNDFVKPKDQRELARFSLARNRTFKNFFLCGGGKINQIVFGYYKNTD